MDREGGNYQQIRLGVSVLNRAQILCHILRVTSVEQIPKHTLFTYISEFMHKLIGCVPFREE